MSPLVVVAGFGRCGSSMVMQMLAAGGLHVHADERASMETTLIQSPEGWAHLLAQPRPAAVKALDPFWPPPGATGLRILWLDRSPREQAKSMAKLLGSLGGVRVDRAERRRLEKDLARSRRKVVNHLRKHHEPPRFKGSTLLELRFEELLEYPRNVSQRIADWLDLGLDPAAMAEVVRPRSPACLPDLAIEAEATSR